MLKLAEIFSDGAVIQREREIRIFGECDREVTVAFDGERVTAKCEDGRFCAIFSPREAGVGYEIKVSDGENEEVRRDICVGEVFIAAGQSNMEMPLGVTDGAEDEIPNSENKNIRFYSIPPQYIKGDYINMPRFQFMDHSAPKWKGCTPETAKDFSAIGYYVAKKMQKALGVPVGVIGCNWGCRCIESFIPTWAKDRNERVAQYYENHKKVCESRPYEDFLRGYEEFKEFLNEKERLYRSPMENSYGNAMYASLYPFIDFTSVKWPAGPFDANRLGCIYHNMIEDITPYGVNFVLWYQGEAHPRGDYFEKYGVLVDTWREAFKNEDLSFYAVELAPWGAGQGHKNHKDFGVWPEIREDQRKATIEYKNCHLATSAGLGDINNVHPIYKRELASRLFRQVMNHSFGAPEKAENPYAVCARFEEDAVYVKFANDDGLAIIGGVADLYLSADGEHFDSVFGKIENGELKVYADWIKNPCEVRYCYNTYYAGQNIFNSAALPASPFRFVLADK